MKQYFIDVKGWSEEDIFLVLNSLNEEYSCSWKHVRNFIFPLYPNKLKRKQINKLEQDYNLQAISNGNLF